MDILQESMSESHGGKRGAGGSKKMCVDRKKKFLPMFQTSNLLDGPRPLPGYFLSLLGNMEVTSNFLSPCSRLWCRGIFNKAPCFS